MTTEYLLEKKKYYEEKCDYFKNIGFDDLATDMQNVVNLIVEIENYIKEKKNV